MLDTYDAIELFGLTENGTDDLPIPSDDELQDQIVGETFETLIGGLQKTGLASEIEPLAHGLATLLQRRATQLDTQADKLKRKINGLIQAQDGSEIAEIELENASRAYEIVWEKAIAMALMAEKAATSYETETGRAYTPVTGSRSTKDALDTGAVFEAKQLLDKADREMAERNTITGPKIAVTGDTAATDHETIYAKLDRAHAKHPDMVLCHKGNTNGVERIAATWARNRKVPQVLFRPNWKGHGRAAPFKANDDLLAANPVGVILFGGNGAALNLGQKAEKRGIKVAAFDLKPAQQA
ncbi:DUF2493 domain-containing protein [Yoonia sp. SS1-5]|uniref:DUF2493 domain-containing protein n=1 Tax=Yoonia rhodophyticola TaxID=3137370 RepID=A0AAN0NKR1_9RHOB